MTQTLKHKGQLRYAVKGMWYIIQQCKGNDTKEPNKGLCHTQAGLCVCKGTQHSHEQNFY